MEQLNLGVVEYREWCSRGWVEPARSTGSSVSSASFQTFTINHVILFIDNLICRYVPVRISKSNVFSVFHFYFVHKFLRG
jgi:hypothetical protein